MNNKSERHSSGLVQHLGFFSAFVVVVSAMIGSGVFKKVAPMSAILETPGLVLVAWLIAGVITLFGALCNAEIAGLIAEPGGQYAYFKRIYGSAFAFFYGWACFSVIQSATIASVAYVFAQSVGQIIPLPVLGAELAHISLFGMIFPFENFSVKLLTLFLIALLTFINYFGIRYGSGLSNILASGIIACMVVLIAAGWIYGTQTPFANLGQTGFGGFSGQKGFFDLVGPVFIAMMSAFWAYEGWNNVGFLGGEVKNPHRNIPLSLICGVGFVMLIYLMINLSYFMVLPISDFMQLNKQPNSIAAVSVAGSLFGFAGIVFVSSLIIMATFNSTNNTILTASRVYFAMARDRLFARQAASCHVKYNTPHISLLLQGLWASVLVISGSFDQLTDMLIFASFIFYGAGAAGVFVLRRTMADAHRPFKTFGYPIIPGLFCLFCLALVVFSLIERPKESLSGLALMLAGLPFYLFWNRKKPDKQF